MPPITRALLIANAAAYILVYILAGMTGGIPAIEMAVRTLGLVPADFWRGAFWQPLTSMFLHGSFFHILFNMIGVWSIGYFLERSLGSARFLWLYLISGLAGALLVVTVTPDGTIPTIGASGALMGMLGAIAILSPNSMLLFLIFPVRARTAALILGGASLLFALTGAMEGISHLGHLGGLIGGYLYTRFALSPAAAQERIYRAGQAGGGAGGIFGGPGSSGPAGPGGGFGAGPRRSAREEMMLRLMEQMLRGSRPAGPAGTTEPAPGPRGEKVINPLPDEGENPTPNKNAERSPDAGDHGKRVVYFDPITGRFYVKEV